MKKKRTLVFLVATLLAVFLATMVLARDSQIPNANSSISDKDAANNVPLDVASGDGTSSPVIAPTEHLTEGTIPQSPIFPFPDGIPVYDQEEFLSSTDLFALNRYNPGLSADWLLSAYPTGAVGVQENGDGYLIYDTDQGNRLYIFLSENLDGIRYEGYPILVGKELSHGDFEGLKTGSSCLADVAKIDPTAQLYTTLFSDDFFDEIYKGRDDGHCCSTIHYLTDGILQIVYDPDMGRTAETLEIFDMIYSPDYILPFSDSKERNYCIAQKDLPYGASGTPMDREAEVLRRQSFTAEDLQRIRFQVTYGKKLEAGEITADEAFVQKYKEAASAEGPLGRVNLGFQNAGQYMRFYLMPLLLLEETGRDDLREKIPVYQEEPLLYTGNVSLGQDFDAHQSVPHWSYSMMGRFPTEAIRSLNGRVYLIYDTDTGYRTYLYVQTDYDHPDIAPLSQFPILIREKMFLKQFASLKLGDPIERVEAIDPRATLHKKTFLEVWSHRTLEDFRLNEEKGLPCTTVHYLADGLLKIEYKMQEDWTLTISDITFSPDYTLVNVWGDTVSYKLDDRDLPWYEGNK